MNHQTPESQGVSSRSILSYLQLLEDCHLTMHDIVMSRGDSIFFSHYYPPFQPDMEHRLYSDSKSLVAIALGFCLQDGLLTLEDKLVDHFPKEAATQTDENFRALTIRNMLMMATAGECPYWFDARISDRVAYYIQSPRKNMSRPGGSYFEYDSTGSFVIGSLVERLTGQSLLDYLTEKLFSKIGVKGPVRALKAPGGHTWSDSAFLMRPEDLLLVMRFLMLNGSWNGEQLLDAAYVKEATSGLISTGDGAAFNALGYGFYIWKFYGEGYFFNGMGCQFAVAVPEKDLIFVCNGDNQGNSEAGKHILTNFYHMIALTAGAPLPDDPQAREALTTYQKTLRLFSAYGHTCSTILPYVNGKRYRATVSNPMGITSFYLHFSGLEGCFEYTNAQGKKLLPFGICKNAFVPFPQKGYSDQVGSQPGHGLYKGAYSAAWKTPTTLWLKIQIIDDYFGNADVVFDFSPDGSMITLSMEKHAEDFLSEYNGYGTFQQVN